MYIVPKVKMCRIRTKWNILVDDSPSTVFSINLRLLLINDLDLDLVRMRTGKYFFFPSRSVYVVVRLV